MKLLKMVGETDFPTENAPVKIVSQDTSTVTVALNQEWTDKQTSVDHIFYEYKESIWSNKCYEETDVVGGSLFETITISCNVMKPLAYLQICIADNVLSPGNDATIPKCCHSENVPPETPTVCYNLEISCETECVEIEADQRRLRGFKK